MLLEVSALGQQPPEGMAADLPVSAGDPLVLSIELLDDEQLDQALLLVRSSSTPGPSPTPVALGTSAAGSWTGVTWVKASWNATRRIGALSLAFASKPDPLTVRLSIARGDSSWFLPPGPYTFTMGASMQLHVELPDTVADRVLVEFFDDQGVAVAVDLSAVDPMIVQLGRAPQDLDLRVRGRRPLLRWAGEVPVEGWVVEDLRARLQAELKSDLRGEAVVLELRAAVAGEVELQWGLEVVRIAERFVDGASTRAMTIGWAQQIDELLLPAEVGAVTVEAVAMSFAAMPSPERLVLGPGEDDPSGNGQLVGPLLDAAQPFTLALGVALTGIDVRARALVPGTSMSLSLRADASGRPSTAAVVELRRTLEARMLEADWISFDLPAPSSIAAGRWWIVLRVSEGELSWRVGPQLDGGGLRYRRDRSAWLARTPAQGAVVRLRAHGDPPAVPVTLSLRGIPADGTTPAWERPLALADDGTARWSIDAEPPPPASTRVSLRIAAEVTTSVALSNLVLRHRAVAP